MKFYLKFKSFKSEMSFSKWRLQNGVQFVNDFVTDTGMSIGEHVFQNISATTNNIIFKLHLLSKLK